MAVEGTPFISIRLNMQTQRAVNHLARMYGAPNRASFLREMITVFCSGDVEKIHAFNTRLFTNIGRKAQMELALAEKRREARRGKT
jgi:hypothetical protein